MIFEAIDFERGLSSEDLAERREDNPGGRKAESKGRESDLPGNDSGLLRNRMRRQIWGENRKKS